MAGVRLIGAALCCAVAAAHGHGRPDVAGATDADRRIEFPDTAEYRTVVFDPHTHSVFSDGHVWPTIRIAEALRDGLDAIAITEHLEYQPHLADIPHPDRNRAYREAAAAAEGSDLIVVSGSEITRNAPAGHINAIFLADANALIRAPVPADPADATAYYASAAEWPAQEAVQAANDQQAFVFWNHPYWGRDFPNGIPVIPEFHVANARAGRLHGIEIANGSDYSEESFAIALEHDLTLIGVSDVHNLIDWDYDLADGGHRPVTLVLAKERTAASIREALFARRTVVWFRNLLIGRAASLDPLLAASLGIAKATYPGDAQVLQLTIANGSDADFMLRNRSRYTFEQGADLIEVPAHGELRLAVRTGTRVESIALDFEVLNALMAPKQTASITLSAAVEMLAAPSP